MDEAEKFREAMECGGGAESPLAEIVAKLIVDKDKIAICSQGPCDCGCGRPARVILDTRGPASFYAAEHLDVLIRTLEELKVAVWPETRQQ